MNFSTWDSKKLKSREQSPAFTPATITIEFDRTKNAKVFSHKLGGITFEDRLQKQRRREEVIEKGLGNIILDGFRYKSIGHVYNENIEVEPIINSEGEYQWPVYAHGSPVGDTFLESCSRINTKCKENEGTDNLCNPGKCVIGFLTRVKPTKWRYESYNTYSIIDSETFVQEPAVYYLPQSPSFQIKNILRGAYHNHIVPKRKWGDINLSWNSLTEQDWDDIEYSDFTYSGFEYNSDNKINITSPASKKSVFFTPPVFYLEDSFVDSIISKYDNKEYSGCETKKEKFIRSIILSTFPTYTQESISLELHEEVRENLKDSLLSSFDDLHEIWKEKITDIVEEEFTYRFINNQSGLEFLSSCYDKLSTLFYKGIQVTKNTLEHSQFNYNKGLNARPIYSRLPGIAEAYRSDPAFSDVETPAQWLTSGVDEFLAKKKDQITEFYSNYLDPERCDPSNLDWLAQHIGLTGNLWDTEFTREQKIALINNAYGWFDRELETKLSDFIQPIKTPKGIALSKFPFVNNKTWSLDSAGINSNKISFTEVPDIKINLTNGVYSTVQNKDQFFVKEFNTDNQITTFTATDSIIFDKKNWNGLFETKGGTINLAFLCSTFGLKAHSSQELEIVDLDKKVFKPKSGLRQSEIAAPILMPIKYEEIQVGSVEDSEINNYSNQLIAGVSRISSRTESKNLFFRVPYYYNRNGNSWKKVEYITKNWIPSHLNARIQYAYLSADLWQVGDAFFEPNYKIDESNT